jgi:hypothetical protein
VYLFIYVVHHFCAVDLFMTANVLRLCEGGEIEAQMFKLAQMFNKIPNVQISIEAPLLQNRC